MSDIFTHNTSVLGTDDRLDERLAGTFPASDSPSLMRGAIDKPAHAASGPSGASFTTNDLFALLSLAAFASIGMSFARRR